MTSSRRARSARSRRACRRSSTRSFKRWSDATTYQHRPDATDPQKEQWIAEQTSEFREYLLASIEERRERPANDFVGRLVVARDGEDGLSETELLAFVSLLLVADNETTTNLIGNGTLALLRNPQQRRLLEERPELIDSAIEEFLRYEGPVQHPAQRVVMEPETFQGVDIPVGDRVVPILASADCDERQWDAPDQLDIERQPNKHVAFGDWIRICIGQYLARVEAKVAIPSLLRTLPEVELAIPEEEITYLPQFNLRGLERLPVRRTT